MPSEIIFALPNITLRMSNETEGEERESETEKEKKQYNLLTREIQNPRENILERQRTKTSW